nr:hypothetical protein [Nitrosomonas nitrosa]
MKWILITAIVATLGAAGLAWADNHGAKPAERQDHQGMMQGGMMRGGMMSMMMNMMHGNNAGMMDECAGMMRESSDGAKKPNDQWRKER